MSRNYKDYERGEMESMSGHGNDNQNINNVVNFRYEVFEPRNVDNSGTLLPEDQYHDAATIVFPELRAGDVVWLNGVVGLENESGDAGADVKVSIFKGVGSPPALNAGQEIYRSDFDIATTDDEAVAPVAHVDVSTGTQRNVYYTLALMAEDDDMFLIGPLTFTGLQLRR